MNKKERVVSEKVKLWVGRPVKHYILWVVKLNLEGKYFKISYYINMVSGLRIVFYFKCTF